MSERLDLIVNNSDVIFERNFPWAPFFKWSFIRLDDAKAYKGIWLTKFELVVKLIDGEVAGRVGDTIVGNLRFSKNEVLKIVGTIAYLEGQLLHIKLSGNDLLSSWLENALEFSSLCRTLRPLQDLDYTDKPEDLLLWLQGNGPVGIYFWKDPKFKIRVELLYLDHYLEYYPKSHLGFGKVAHFDTRKITESALLRLSLLKEKEPLPTEIEIFKRLILHLPKGIMGSSEYALLSHIATLLPNT